MMVNTVSTDENAVNQFEGEIKKIINDIAFKPTDKIKDSTSPATAELEQLIYNFQTTIETYKDCLATESKNVKVVHKAIEIIDMRIAIGMRAGGANNERFFSFIKT